VRARTHEDDRVAVEPVDQQEVAADVALAVIRPFTLERVV
jgi:hypothetical protein